MDGAVVLELSDPDGLVLPGVDVPSWPIVGDVEELPDVPVPAPVAEVTAGGLITMITGSPSEDLACTM